MKNINLVLTMIAFLYVGCNKDSSPVTSTDSSDVIIPSTTKVISSTDFANQLLSVSSDSSTFIFKQGVGSIDNLAIDDIMVSNKGSGLLRKISSIDKSNNQITVQTTQAVLEEAIQKGTLDITKTLTPADTMNVLYKIKGLNLRKKSAHPNKFSLSLNDVIIYDGDGNPSTKGDQMVANGSVELTLGFKFYFSVDNWKLNKLLMSTTVNENSQLSISMNLLNVDYSKKKEIMRATFSPMTFLVGTFPVVLTPVLSISVGVDGIIYANLSSSISQNAEFTGGLKYENGSWSPIVTQSHSFSYQPPTITAGAELKGYIGPQLDLLLYGVVGPTVGVSLYGKVVADLTQNPWLTLWVGISVDAGIEMEILSNVLAEYQINVLDLKTKIWENSSPPNQTPNLPSNPSPTNNATNQSTLPILSWSCADPENDPLTFDVYFGTSINPPLIVQNQTNMTYNPGTLNASSNYWWKIVAKDDHSNTTMGPLWKFTTASASSSRILTVQSDPDGATISITPADNNNNSSGVTPLARSYNNGTNVTLTAGSSLAGATFHHWEKDGTQVSTSVSYTITMNGNYTLKAVYESNKTISGHIATSSGSPVSGVSVSFSGTSVPATTDVNGDYQITVSFDYTGTATPNKNGYTFIPSFRQYQNIRTNQIGQNYTAFSSGGSITDGMVNVASGTLIVDATQVAINSFNIDIYEVTYEFWTEVRNWGLTNGYSDLPTGQNGQNPVGANNPVTYVSWYDVIKWCNARSEKEGLTPVYYTNNSQVTIYRTGQIDLTSDAVKWTANGYRLPTECEWEFAARGGTLKHDYIYSGSNTIGDVAWFYDNSGSTTHTVCQKSANELGIYDMSGNVWEWCWDWWDSTYPSGITDPKGPATTKTYRLVRGGAFYVNAPLCRVDFRSLNYLPNHRLNALGFRCVQD
jgi:formylglycine-generating enzyme required for sulfatase activity